MPLQKQKRKRMSPKTIVTIFIVVLMVSSIAGILTSKDNEEGRLLYNGHDFVLINGVWNVKLDGQSYGFDFHPAELEQMNVSNEALARLISSQVVYFTFDPGWKDASYLDLMRLQFDMIIPEQYGLQFVSAVTNNETVTDSKGVEISYGLPIITCADAGGLVPVIYAREAESTSLWTNGTCIMLDAASGLDLLRMRDRMLYTYLGIMI